MKHKETPKTESRKEKERKQEQSPQIDLTKDQQSFKSDETQRITKTESRKE